MKVVIQRVKHASVEVEGRITGAIGHGLLLLVGFEESDHPEDLEWMSRKVVNMRIFNDEQGLMNLSLKEVKGEILTVSQFTLHASTKKGNRPSFIAAARPEQAIPLYETFNDLLKLETGKAVKTGIFGAMMEVTLLNDGPVTIIIDSKNKI